MSFVYLYVSGHSEVRIRKNSEVSCRNSEASCLKLQQIYFEIQQRNFEGSQDLFSVDPLLS